MYTAVLVILLLMIVLSDVFFYFHLKKKESKPIFLFLHIIPAIIFAGIFIYIKFGLENSHNFRIIAWVMWIYFFFLILYISKIIHIIFYFLNFMFKKVAHHDDIYFNIVRVVLTVFVISVMLISAYITPQNFEVTHVQVKIHNLPPAFNHYKIVQLSDIHLGSWNRKHRKFIKVIGLVNEQKPDIIVFTGDMVNNFATEAAGWQSFFQELKAKDGKFAILGNHDYGDYTEWKSEKERMQNRFMIIQSIHDFGFRLLLNEHIQLHKENDSLVLVGVENWGKSEKFRYSNLKMALKGTQPESIKILLAHDPNEFDAEIAGKKDIVLTLSGHTHAGQMGFRLNNKLYSPASLVFKYWSGLYKVGTQQIYVNRGIGYIGLPMFIGVKPEITVIELINDKK